MNVRPVQWLGDGTWGIRLVDLPANVVQSNVLNRNRKGRAIVCRHYQIWYNGQERRVVDRALTKQKALQCIRRFKEEHMPLFGEP